MTRHTGWAVGLLLILLLMLLVMIASYMMGLNQQTGDAGVHTAKVQDQIIEDENGKYGLIDAYGNTLIEPQWESLHFFSEELLLAQQSKAEGAVYGILDTDGNVIVPFVYTDISAVNAYYSAARLSQQYVLYDSRFVPFDAMLWDSIEVQGEQLILTSGSDAFRYRVHDEELNPDSAQMERAVSRYTVTAKIESREMEMLSVSDWQTTADLMQKVAAALAQQNFEAIPTVTQGDMAGALTGALTLHNESFSRFGRETTPEIEQVSGHTRLKWSIPVYLRQQDRSVQSRALTIDMQKNSRAVWMVTNAQIVNPAGKQEATV